MDFHGMKRKNLQTLCKKHGIPGNLKNDEMASRLASLFEKGTAVVNEITPEPIKDDLAVCREAKKVKFSPENEVFEFTRSVKKCQRRNARTCRERPAQGEIALRRSKRSVLHKNKEEELVRDNEKEVSVDFKVEETRKYNRRNVLNAPKVEKVLRRSRRLVNKDEVELNTHEDFKIEKELVKNSVKEVYEDFEVEETKKCNQRNVFDAPKVEKVLRRSRRLVNNSEVELNHEDSKIENEQSIKLTTDVAKPCIGGKTADSPLCPPKDGKEERKVKKSKGSGAANGTEGEPAKDNTKKSSIDCKLQKNEKDRKTKMQDVEKVPRRSKRLGNNVNVDTDMKPVVDEKRNALKRVYLEKSDNSQGGALGSRASELLEDGKAQKGNNQLKNSVGNDFVGAAVDNTQDQAMANLSKKCSARGDELDGASVDTMDKSKVNDEMIVPARFTRNSARQNSKKVPVVVEGNVVEKKDQPLDSLVKSPKRVTRRMKRGRTEEVGMSKDTLSIQRNQKFLVVNGKLEPGDAGIRNATELGGTNVEAESSSKKTKKVNQELVKDNQQEIVEGSTSSSESKTIEHDMIAENVFDSSPRKSVDSSKKTNTQEVSSDLVEEGREGKHEQDTVFMVALKKDKEEASPLSAVLIERSSVNKSNDELQSEVKTFSNSENSDGYLVVETTPLPTSVPLAVTEPEVELSIPTGHIFDISQRTNTEELSSELMEEELESNHEQDTILMIATNKDKEEASSLSLVPIERSSGNDNTGLQSKVKTCPDNHSTDDYLFVEPTPPFASVQLTMSNLEAELIKPTDHIFENNTLTVIRTKEDTLISTHRPELKDNSSVSKLETTAKMETSAERGKEIILCKDNEKGSPEKEIQAANLHGNLAECNSENINAEKVAKITKVECDTSGSDGNISSQMMLMLITSSLEEQTVSEQKEAYEMSPNKVNEDAETGSTSKEKSLLVKPNLPNMDIGPVFVEEVCMETVSNVGMAQTAKNVGKTDLISPLCKGREYSMEKTPLSISMDHSSTETNICGREEIDLHAKVDGSVTYEKNNVLHGDKSKDMANNVVLLSTSTTRSQEESPSRRGKDNLNLKDNDNLTEEEKEASFCEVRNCEKLEPPVDPKDSSLVKSVQAIFGERGCKVHSLELREWSLTDFATLSPKVENVSNCAEEDELKALSQPLPTNRAVSVLDESPIFTIPERNLQLMEQLSKKGKTRAAHSVTSHNYEAVQSRDIIFTTPEQGLFMGYTGVDEAGNKKGHKATDIPDESDILNTAEGSLMLEDSRQNEAKNNGESIAVEIHDESIIATSPVRHTSVRDCEGDVGGKSEENKNVEFHCESDKSSDKSSLLTSLERQLMYGDSLQREAGKTTEKADAEFHHESAIPNIPKNDTLPEDFELNEAAKTDEDTKSEENKAVELHVDCGIIMSYENHSAFETDEGVKRDNIIAKSLGESDVFTTTKRHSLMGDPELDEAEQYRENTDVELLGESNTFTAATCEERQGFLENSKQHTSGDKGGNKVEFKDESAYFTRLESCLLLGEPGQDRLDIGKSDINQYQSHYASSPIVTLKDDKVVPESHVGVRDNSTNDSYECTTFKVSNSHEFNVGQESAGKPKDHQANDVVDLHATQGTLKKSKAHSPYVETVNHLVFDIEETKTIMDAGGNDSSNNNEELRSKECEHPDTYKTISETIGFSVGEFSSRFEDSGACSLVSEEPAPSTEIQNQINNSPEELLIADPKGVGELIEAKVGMVAGLIVQSGRNKDHEGDLQLFTSCDTSVFGEIGIQNQIDNAPVKTPIAEIKGISDLIEAEVTNNTREGMHPADNVQTRKNRDHEGNLQLFTSCDTSVFEDTCVSAEKDGLNLGFNRIEDSGNTCEESDCNVPEDEATDSIAATFTLQNETRGQFTFQNNKNEKETDTGEEMVPEEALNESSYGTRTPCQKQTIRPPTLIHRTQVKPKRHDMKENAQSSKIVQNLNVTAPRTSKRQPLQDLRKIN